MYSLRMLSSEAACVFPYCKNRQVVVDPCVVVSPPTAAADSAAHSDQIGFQQQGKLMEATSASGSPAASRAAWICLAIAWVCFIVPIPGIGLFIGWPLNLVAFILAIVAMAKRGAMSGLLQLLASLIASPIIYLIGLAIFGAAMTGVGDIASKVETDAGEPAFSVASSTDAPVASARASDAIMVSATELFAAYKANEIADDQRYKGKALKVPGVIEDITSDAFDKAVVQLQAGGFMEQVHASGLSNEAAAQLSKGVRVTLLCNGGGEVIGFPLLEDCVIAE